MITAFLLGPKVVGLILIIFGTILFLCGMICYYLSKKKKIKINLKIIPFGLLIFLMGITISQ